MFRRMTILFYIILGLIAGAIAKLILPGKQGGGIIATIILGIIGALIGGLLFNLLAGHGFTVKLYSGFWWSLLTAIVGAIIVLLIYGAIRRRSAA